MPEPALVAATDLGTSSPAELALQARALETVYQKTWRLEDVNTRIHLYLCALDLLSHASVADEPRSPSLSPAPKNFAVGEPLAEAKGGHRTCKIRTCRWLRAEQRFSNASLNRDISARHHI